MEDSQFQDTIKAYQTVIGYLADPSINMHRVVSELAKANPEIICAAIEIINGGSTNTVKRSLQNKHKHITDEIYEYVTKGEQTKAIKKLRDMTGSDLRSAKEYFDTVYKEYQMIVGEEPKTNTKQEYYDPSQVEKIEEEEVV